MTTARKRRAAQSRCLSVFCGLLAVLFGSPALSLEFPVPQTVTGSREEALTSYRLPVGPWSQAGIPTRVAEGRMTQTAWRLDAPGRTTLELLAPLRAQMAAEGFAPLFECETSACGGFDFRYGTDILPEPDMHVDLGDFRYYAAERATPLGPEVVSLLVSRSATSGFVQMTRVGAVPEPRITASTKSPEPLPPSDDIGLRLETGGAQPLEDLIFASGSAELIEGEYPSLVALAAYLRAHPERSIAIVGHTDASGALAGNVALSRERAQSVRDRLIRRHSVPTVQVSAEGVGYLAPRDSNLTDEGRARNRRVEVMLTSVR